MCVGGIGANRLHPAPFCQDNFMMGVQLLHEAFKAGVQEFVATGTVCAYPKFTPVSLTEDELWTHPEETNAERLIGFRFGTTFDEGLRTTVSWHSEQRTAGRIV
jgi:nucleoside-diphosphate-sugar epimerase